MGAEEGRLSSDGEGKRFACNGEGKAIGSGPMGRFLSGRPFPPKPEREGQRMGNHGALPLARAGPSARSLRRCVALGLLHDISNVLEGGESDRICCSTSWPATNNAGSSAPAEALCHLGAAAAHVISWPAPNHTGSKTLKSERNAP